MKNNKKGFTLVELLAVIVILAVVILIAVTAVIPRMNKAKRKAFDDEALAYIKAAEEYVVAENDGIWPAKVDLSTLNGTYIEVKNGKTYTGCVKQVSNVTKIWITDGATVAAAKYEILGKSASEIQSSGAVDAATGLGTNCN